MASLPPPPVGGGMPPEGGPPPQMGAPSLANIPPSGPQMGGPEQGGALPRLVFQIEQSLQTLARALPPGSSQKIDMIREQLRGAVAEALSGGGEPAPGPQQEGGPF